MIFGVLVNTFLILSRCFRNKSNFTTPIRRWSSAKRFSKIYSFSNREFLPIMFRFVPDGCHCPAAHIGLKYHILDLSKAHRLPLENSRWPLALIGL